MHAPSARDEKCTCHPIPSALWLFNVTMDMGLLTIESLDDVTANTPAASVCRVVLPSDVSMTSTVNASSPLESKHLMLYVLSSVPPLALLHLSEPSKLSHSP